MDISTYEKHKPNFKTPLVCKNKYLRAGSMMTSSGMGEPKSLHSQGYATYS